MKLPNIDGFKTSKIGNCCYFEVCSKFLFLSLIDLEDKAIHIVNRLLFGHSRMKLF